MPRVERRAQVLWQGNLARGGGTMGSQSGALDGLAVDLPARIGDPAGKTSPEELLAAAQAGCFAMSLAGELVRAGYEPEQVEISVTCTLDELEGGEHAITAFSVEARARAAGLDDEQRFAELLAAAHAGCPVARLLGAGAEVRVDGGLA